MPASVRDALKEAFQQAGGVSAEEAEQMLATMEKTGRFQSDTWSWSPGPNNLLTTLGSVQLSESTYSNKWKNNQKSLFDALFIERDHFTPQKVHTLALFVGLDAFSVGL